MAEHPDTVSTTPHVRTYSRLQPLPPGHATPHGWLADYARANADGWVLHYARSKDSDVYGKFWNRNPTHQVTFSENNVTQVLCDYTAYFGDALLRYAQILPEAQVAQEAAPWVEQMLASQDADGYLGAFEPQARWRHWLEVFSQSLVLEALLYRYEATGDRRLLDASERAARHQMAIWRDPPAEWQPGIFSGHGTITIRLLSQLYRLTGEREYLDVARAILKKWGRMERFLTHHDALYYEHNVVGTEHVGLPEMLYEYGGNARLLKASRAAWDTMMQKHMSAGGIPHGNEGMTEVGPRQNCEHCSAVEWFITSHAIFRMTGEVKYADAAERAVLNGYPASKSPDGMTLGYMHAPNQLVATEWSNPSFSSLDWWASRQHFSSAHEPLCCNSNSPRLLPYYIESLVTRTAKALAVVYYAPATVRAALPGVGRVTLQMDTAYPFEDEVRITVTPPSEATFPLQLRIPGWAAAASVQVNGRNVDVAAAPGTLATLRRRWRPGDVVTLRFDFPVHLTHHPKSEYGVRAAGVAVHRRPLTFALPVPEDWRRFDPPAFGPPAGEVIAYRLFPAPDAVWNVALALDKAQPETSFRMVRLPVPDGSRAWEHPPFGLHVSARRVRNWRMDGEPEHPMTPGLPFQPVALADAETTVTLVPYGFTHLRMTFLPTVP